MKAGECECAEIPLHRNDAGERREQENECEVASSNRKTEDEDERDDGDNSEGRPSRRGLRLDRGTRLTWGLAVRPGRAD